MIVCRPCDSGWTGDSSNLDVCFAGCRVGAKLFGELWPGLGQSFCAWFLFGRPWIATVAYVQVHSFGRSIAAVVSVPAQTKGLQDEHVEKPCIRDMWNSQPSNPGFYDCSSTHSLPKSASRSLLGVRMDTRTTLENVAVRWRSDFGDWP